MRKLCSAFVVVVALGLSGCVNTSMQGYADRNLPAKKLGGPKLAEARERAVVSIVAGADRLAANVVPIIREMQRAGMSTLRDIAEALNARGVPTARGGLWYASTVRNILTRS